VTGGRPALRVLGREAVRYGAHTIMVDTDESRVYLTLGDDLTGELIGCAGGGRGAAVLGLPAVDPASPARVAGAFQRAAVPLLVAGALGQWPAAAGAIRAAHAERVGQPVFLRYAAEWGASATWHAAEALLLAESALGPTERVFASGPTSVAGAGYVSVTVEHASGARSLLGCGAGPADGGPAAPASLLLLGDTGVMEVTPEGAAIADADGWLDVLAEWLPGALRALRVRPPESARQDRWRRALALLGAVRRSQGSGRPESPEGTR
jgi:hypothetical protein